MPAEMCRFYTHRPGWAPSVCCTVAVLHQQLCTCWPPTHLHLFVFILACCLIYRMICCSDEAMTHTYFYDPHISSSVILLSVYNPPAFAQAVVRRLWAWCCSCHIWDMVFTCTQRNRDYPKPICMINICIRVTASHFWDRPTWDLKLEWLLVNIAPVLKGKRNKQMGEKYKIFRWKMFRWKEKKMTNCRLGTLRPRVQEGRRHKIDGWMFMSV